MTPAGLILAAGESSRMGRDKALLPYAGTTFVEHLVRLFLTRVSPVVVVIGHHAGEIQAAVPSLPGVQVVFNPKYQAGQLSSLQTGLGSIRTDRVLFTLVDHPAVAPGTLDSLLAHSRAPLVIPRYQNRRGHPILLAGALIGEILALPPEATAKQVVHSHLSEAILLDLEDPGILRDIDTPEDYCTL